MFFCPRNSKYLSASDLFSRGALAKVVPRALFKAEKLQIQSEVGQIAYLEDWNADLYCLDVVRFQA